VSDPPDQPGAGAPRAGPPRFSWPVAALALALLLGLNSFWYLEARRLRGSQVLFLLAGSAAYFGLLRLCCGLRFGDVSAEGRFVVLSGLLLLSAFLWLGRIPPGGRPASLGPFFHFSLSSVLFRSLLPLLAMGLIFRRRPRELGWRLRGTSRLGWIYLGLLLVVLPAVAWASARRDFQATYPQARGLVADGSVSLELFVLYQAAYLLVFLSGESFWRGYLVFGLERDLGDMAIPWMVMLYSIGHYGKPFLETNAAILAGSMLGWLALRHRSFWLGVALHWTVALTMDLAVLWRLGIVFG
jgi:CAAX protease family protein